MSLAREEVRGEEPDRTRATNGRDQESRRRHDREIAPETRVAELEAEIRARDDFLAIAAHELRNPMTPIAGRVELLLKLARRASDRVPPEILSGLERLEYLVDAYVRRATTFLDISRISSRNLQLTLAQVDLSSVVRETVTSMSPAADGAGCRISLAVEEHVMGSFDRTAAEQIVENLLSNALRYGAGQPINVSLARDANIARLSVSDRGIGISHADQARIFEQFQRAAGNNTDGGFGVGLWITRELVLAMGGEISVVSEIGAGSTFTVSLPLKGS
jgi:signal transduction histidine kinase